MNKQEKRILHGLYYYREIVDEKALYSPSEINWLINNCISKGKGWKGEDGKLKSIEIPNADYLASIGATTAAAERPLAYLQATGYITYEKASNMFRIAVTGTGADKARELDTYWGRANLFFRKHKDGILGLVMDFPRFRRHPSGLL